MSFHIKKPQRLSWISEENWALLKIKEKDFMMMLSARKFTKKQIMRRLYIETPNGYWRLKTKIEETLKEDIAVRNKKYEKALIESK